VKITYDFAKRERTILERGLDFERVNEVFSGLTLTIEDDRQRYGEARSITMGFLDQRMVVVVWTWRDGTCRVISMRKANEREIRRFTQSLG
jgi:uncharacterized DUF497 family protein